jgi:carbamoyl-phosphate synthase large subunit
MKKVLVTGVGGVVGQGILRNLLREDFGIGIIGTNVTAITAGNHLCDAVHMVPYAFDPDYVPAMRALVETERVDLVIPSTDYEAYHLMRAKVQIPATIAASPADVSALSLDQFAMWNS